MADLSQSATLVVKLEDAAGGGSAGGSGSPSSPRGGHGKPVRSNQFSYAGLTGNPRMTRFRTGVTPPPIQHGKPIGLMGGLPSSTAGLMMVASSALTSFTTALRVATDVTTMESTARARMINNDVLGAEATRTRARGQVLGNIPIIGPLIRAMHDFGANQQENFIREMGAWRQRIEKLAQFNPQLGKQTAEGRLAEARRQIGEAQALGPEYQTLLQEQQKLEDLQAKLALVEKMKGDWKGQGSVKDELYKTRLKITETQGKLGIELSNLNKNARDLVNRLGAGKTPIQKLLDGLRLPDLSKRRADDDVLDKLRDDMIGRPIFGGAP